MLVTREWRTDRRAVFERDDFVCQYCKTAAQADGLRTYPVGSVPVQTQTVHESLLVTVCDNCFTTLREGVTDHHSPEDLFETVRDLTRAQGQAIADTAGFASLATDLPGDLESGDLPDYPDSRRELLLSLAFVDQSIEALPEPSDPAHVEPLQDFVEVATTSQSEVRRVIELVETLVAGLGRCHVCFDLVAGEDRCPTCRTDRLSGDAWRGADGSMSFDTLYASINGTLAETSRTTEALTAHATTLAEVLLEES